MREGKTLIIDEIGLISYTDIKMIYRVFLRCKSLKVYCFGDFMQCESVDGGFNISDSDMLKGMCEYNRITLTKVYRYDDKLRKRCLECVNDQTLTISKRKHMS